jgi:hypothetical protein
VGSPLGLDRHAVADVPGDVVVPHREVAGHLTSDFEATAVTWQAAQHQPDSLAALVVAFDVLVHSAG